MHKHNKARILLEEREHFHLLKSYNKAVMGTLACTSTTFWRFENTELTAISWYYYAVYSK